MLRNYSLTKTDIRLTNNYDIEIGECIDYKEETEDLEEFDGRFFVKIKRDNDLDKSLLSFVQNPTYGVEHTCRLFYINYLPYNTNENDSRRQGRYASY